VNTIIKEGDNCLDFILQRSTISYFLKASSSKGRIVGRRAFSQRSAETKYYMIEHVEEGRKELFEWQVC
jgi:hypothetical protein